MPDSQREGAYALGATRWQMVRGSVLPAAAPGIVTGIILAMARAIGEAAPIIVIGAAAFVTFLPTPLQEGFSVLPIQVYQWASRPQADFQGIAAATILVMLVPDASSSTAWPSSSATGWPGTSSGRGELRERIRDRSAAAEPAPARHRRGEPARSGSTPTLEPAATRSRSWSARSPSSSRTCRCYYGSFRAVRDVSIDVAPARGHRADRPVRLGQVDRSCGRSTG